MPDHGMIVGQHDANFVFKHGTMLKNQSKRASFTYGMTSESVTGKR
jgi:hypothetical protein